MSRHFDNVVHEADMDSSEPEEDSNTEEEYSHRAAPPTHRRSPIEHVTPPTTSHATHTPNKKWEINRPMPLQIQPVTKTSGHQDESSGSGVVTRHLDGIQKWTVVILVVALCASLCHTLAFSSGSWMQNGNTHIGLWMDCNCSTYTPDGDSMKWLTSSKVFLGIALLIAVVMALTVPVYTAQELMHKKKTLAKLLYKCIDGTLGMILIGFLPVGLLFDITYDLGVGFGLCVVAALLCLPKHVLLAVCKQDDFYSRFNWPHTAITLFYLIAVHFLLVCYSTSSWASSGNTHIGLWMQCTCGGSTVQDEQISSAFIAVQAMITVGEILLLLNVFIMAVLAGLPVTNTKRNVLITSIYIISFTAGITTVIADVMFATKIVEGYKLGYSFIFSIVSAVFCIIASCIAVLRRSSARSQTNPMSTA